VDGVEDVFHEAFGQSVSLDVNIPCEIIIGDCVMTRRFSIFADGLKRIAMSKTFSIYCDESTHKKRRARLISG
jgi:hypothetical protein